MAMIELAATLHGTSNVQALAGRVLSLSVVCRGVGGQGLGRPPFTSQSIPTEATNNAQVQTFKKES